MNAMQLLMASETTENSQMTKNGQIRNEIVIDDFEGLNFSTMAGIK